MESLGFVTVIISIVLLIVFLIMASNISKILKELTAIRKEIAPTRKEHIWLAEREAFRGNNEKAIQHYQNLRYECEPYVRLKVPLKFWKEINDNAEARIRKLKG